MIILLVGNELLIVAVDVEAKNAIGRADIVMKMSGQICIKMRWL